MCGHQVLDIGNAVGSRSGLKIRDLDQPLLNDVVDEFEGDDVGRILGDAAVVASNAYSHRRRALTRIGADHAFKFVEAQANIIGLQYFLVQ